MILTVELVAVDIRDKSTPQSSTRIELKIQNSEGIVDVENKGSKPYSTHKFTLNDSDNIFGDFWSLREEEESILFATALSLSNERIFFSTQGINFLNALKQKEVEEKKPITLETNGNKSIHITNTVHITETVEILKISNLIIDEAHVLLILKKLVSFRMFDASVKRTLKDENIKESIEKYREALESSVSSRESCYKSLYASFEKAVNADIPCKFIPHNEFVERASNMTKLPNDVIENLCTFNNRDKHWQKSEENIKIYGALKNQFDSLVAQLKVATDQAILYRYNLN